MARHRGGARIDEPRPHAVEETQPRLRPPLRAMPVGIQFRRISRAYGSAFSSPIMMTGLTLPFGNDEPAPLRCDSSHLPDLARSASRRGLAGCRPVALPAAGDHVERRATRRERHLDREGAWPMPSYLCVHLRQRSDARRERDDGQLECRSRRAPRRRGAAVEGKASARRTRARTSFSRRPPPARGRSGVFPLGKPPDDPGERVELRAQLARRLRSPVGVSARCRRRSARSRTRRSKSAPSDVSPPLRRGP